MISLENQVTSLELSKRLKELGVKQDSAFAWYRHSDSAGHEHIYCEYRLLQASWDAQSTYHDGYAKLPIEICSAFTVAEHGIALPRSIRSYRDTNAKEEFWVCKLPYKKTEYADTEANARAQMRIWLIENKLVEME